MQNIMRMSYFFKMIFIGIFLIIAAFFIGAWGSILLGMSPMPQHAIASFLQGLFWTTTSLIFLYLLITLFRQYEKGRIYSLENVIIMRNIGYVLIAKAIIPALFLTMSHLNVLYGLSSIGFENLIIAGLFILNSWIMKEGFHFKEDSQLAI